MNRTDQTGNSLCENDYVQRNIVNKFKHLNFKHSDIN